MKTQFIFIISRISVQVIQILTPHIRSLFLIHYLFRRPEGQRTVLCDLCSLQGAQGMLGTSCVAGQSYSWSSSLDWCVNPVERTFTHTQGIYVLFDNNSLDKSSPGSLACIQHSSCSIWKASMCATKLIVTQSILSMLRCQGYRGGTAACVWSVFSPCVEELCPVTWASSWFISRNWLSFMTKERKSVPCDGRLDKAFFFSNGYKHVVLGNWYGIQKIWSMNGGPNIILLLSFCEVNLFTLLWKTKMLLSLYDRQWRFSSILKCLRTCI